jgi:hypothetical protein
MVHAAVLAAGNMRHARGIIDKGATSWLPESSAGILERHGTVVE